MLAAELSIKRQRDTFALEGPQKGHHSYSFSGIGPKDSIVGRGVGVRENEVQRTVISVGDGKGSH